MMNRTFTKIRSTDYSLFLIILVNSCCDSPKKGISVTTNGNKPLVDTISISNMKFHPEEIEVNKGDTVIWINHDMVIHDVTEIPDKKWTSSKIPPEGSWKLVVTQSSQYYCAIHPVMKGRIVMK